MRSLLLAHPELLDGASHFTGNAVAASLFRECDAVAVGEARGVARKVREEEAVVGVDAGAVAVGWLKRPGLQAEEEGVEALAGHVAADGALCEVERVDFQ